MDKSTAASNAIRLINQAKYNMDIRPSMIEAVCSYFDFMKGKTLSQADRLFMHYLANQAGLPQYYYPMLNIGEDVDEEVCLQTFSKYIQESDLIVGEGVMLHRYQKEVLELFKKGQSNRYFLSAATSFGKTFLIYEVVRKMKYSNVAFIFLANIFNNFADAAISCGIIAILIFYHKRLNDFMSKKSEQNA